MGSIEETIEVDCPVRAVYNHWTQFEEFSRVSFPGEVQAGMPACSSALTSARRRTRHLAEYPSVSWGGFERRRYRYIHSV